MPPKNEPKKRPKIEPKQLKTIWLELNPETTCFLCNLASIGHISSFQLWITIRLKRWILVFWSFKTICDCPKKLTTDGLDFELKLTSLCCHTLCTIFLQPTISSSFQLWILICLKHWILDLLCFKTICDVS